MWRCRLKVTHMSVALDAAVAVAASQFKTEKLFFWLKRRIFAQNIFRFLLRFVKFGTQLFENNITDKKFIGRSEAQFPFLLFFFFAAECTHLSHISRLYKLNFF